MILELPRLSKVPRFWSSMALFKSDWKALSVRVLRPAVDGVDWVNKGCELSIFWCRPCC